MVNGRKFFVSLAGAAPYYATPASALGDEPWIERTLYLQVPKDAPGVTFQGEWDPMGMRAPSAGTWCSQDVFVPDEAEVLPPGGFGALYNAFPHLPLSFSATFLGLDAGRLRLHDRLPDRAGARRAGLQTEAPAKGYAVAEMLFTLEAARALYYRAISEARVDPAARGRAARPGRPRHRAALRRGADPGGDPGLRRPGAAEALPARALRPRCARRRR